MGLLRVVLLGVRTPEIVHQQRPLPRGLHGRVWVGRVAKCGRSPVRSVERVDGGGPVIAMLRAPWRKLWQRRPGIGLVCPCGEVRPEKWVRARREGMCSAGCA